MIEENANHVVTPLKKKIIIYTIMNSKTRTSRFKRYKLCIKNEKKNTEDENNVQNISLSSILSRK